jgi:uncharacterized membrane protein
MKPHFVNEFYDPMVDNPQNYKLGIFYFNRKDKRLIVPKRKRMLGWTMNFARPGAYLWVIIIIAIVIFSLVIG